MKLHLGVRNLQSCLSEKLFPFTQGRMKRELRKRTRNTKRRKRQMTNCLTGREFVPSTPYPVT